MKIVLGTLTLALSGCATFEVASNVQRGSPRFFAGTELNAAAIAKDHETLSHFSRYGMTPPAYPEVDLVFSFVADAALLPFALSYTLDEAILR